MLLSVIYPVHVTRESKYIIDRINKCLSNTINGLPHAEHIIVLSGDLKYTQVVEEKLEVIQNKLREQHNANQAKQVPSDSSIKASSLKICHWISPTIPYSPGTARNIGIETSQGEQLLFWDIDLLGSPALFSAIPKHQETLQQQSQAFYIYPCLYLTPSYSKSFTTNFEQAYQDVIQLKTNTIEHIALATSTLLCDKQHLVNLGAFDESFVGHMGEDLELINRLAIAYNKYPLPEDHLVDAPSKVPNQLKGFRRLFAQYALPNFEQQQFSVHMAHATKLGSNYKQSQASNMKYFQEKMQNSIASIRLTPCEQQNFGKETYLNCAPPIKLSSTERRQKKWQKLRRDPPLFFRDMFNKIK